MRTRCSHAGFVTLVATCVLFGCGGPQAAAPTTDEPATATPEEVVQAARGMLEQYRQAYEVGSLEALAPLYSQTLDLALTNQGRHLQGWTAVERYLNRLLTEAAEIHIRFQDTSVVALGPGGAGVTTGMQRSVSDGVATVDESGILSLALRQEEEGRWVIVQEHFSYRRGIE